MNVRNSIKKILYKGYISFNNVQFIDKSLYLFIENVLKSLDHGIEVVANHRIVQIISPFRYHGIYTKPFLKIRVQMVHHVGAVFGERVGSLILHFLSPNVLEHDEEVSLVQTSVSDLLSRVKVFW